MTKPDKLRKRIEQEPKNVRFEDLDRLLLAYGLEVRQAGHGGSHHFYSKGRVTITVPRRRQQMPPVCPFGPGGH